tara:strand:+ start:3437 stop:4114 length:678 start_codon:yes stop_codon:yes gene_type:complete
MELSEIISFFGTAPEDLGIGGILLSISMAAISGLLLRITLSFVNQRWASTYHHTMTCILLPVITFTITKVIAGNIALSLGMIGALSIVRFRNPVKNPFELVIYFSLITIGIAYAVRVNYGILLIGMIILIIIFAYYLEIILSKFNLNFYTLSFDEGINSHYLEIASNSKIDALSQNENLVQYLYSKNDKQHNYRLAFRSKEALEKLKKNLEQEESVDSIEVRYIN